MHFLQSQQWRNVKEALGNKTFSAREFWAQTTKIPYSNSFAAYMPRADLKNLNYIELVKTLKDNRCAFLTIDPINLKEEIQKSIEFVKKENPNIKVKFGNPVHLKYNTIINLAQSEEEFLKNFKPKHRYNLKIGQKNNVEVKIDSTNESFETFLKLYKETGDRQKYFDRSESYLRTVWNTLNSSGEAPAFIATAFYNSTPVISWMLFVDGNSVYYPYGGSSNEYRNIMANYCLVWEIIKWAKAKNLKEFDLWGIKPSNPNLDELDFSDGYSRFKTGFGGKIIEYANTVDIVLNPLIYKIYKIRMWARERLRI